MMRRLTFVMLLTLAPLALGGPPVTQKPLLHGTQWMAITGKPLAATAGAKTFIAGGNAIDAACAMLAATATMWDVLGWGGETQALIWHPTEKRVIAVNALGVAPTGATPEFFHAQGMEYPPEYGPLAAVTPGTPGGLLTMLAEYGQLSLAEVLGPAISMAREGYPLEWQAAHSIVRDEKHLRQWPSSEAVFFPNGEKPQIGQVFVQADLAATLTKLVEAERDALAAGASRKEAIYAAYERFYRGDIAQELVRGTQELGGLITLEDLDRWQVYLEEPVTTNYDGIDVYKLTSWVQGPMMLQTLNILEQTKLAELGYNSADYIHTLYQAMSLAFADRDFYYGDPYFPPAEPLAGLLSKQYAADRAATIDAKHNDPFIKPGDPYPYQGERNPYLELLKEWTNTPDPDGELMPPWQVAATDPEHFERTANLGTTAIQTADAEGWVVSVTPSGGWIPAVIAGRTGIGLSQRMQSFVLDPAQNPFNVLEPGKRPRATLTPAMALKDGRPWLSFSIQGGDFQEQNLLQMFLNMHHFGMDVQQAAEAANFWSYQFRNSFDDHRAMPGRILVNAATPPWVIAELEGRGYDVETGERTSGPLMGIEIDHERGTFQGGASNYGDDYGIAW
ncbi:MAG TPA: gamma-glutamyltransferase [Pseudomonadales bacterium]